MISDKKYCQSKRFPSHKNIIFLLTFNCQDLSLSKLRSPHLTFDPIYNKSFNSDWLENQNKFRFQFYFYAAEKRSRNSIEFSNWHKNSSTFSRFQKSNFMTFCKTSISILMPIFLIDLFECYGLWFYGILWCELWFSFPEKSIIKTKHFLEIYQFKLGWIIIPLRC